MALFQIHEFLRTSKHDNLKRVLSTLKYAMFFLVLEGKNSDCCKLRYWHQTFFNLQSIHSHDFVPCLLVSNFIFLSWNNKLLHLPAWKISKNIKVTFQKMFFKHSSYNNSFIVYLQVLDLKQWVFHKFVSDEAVVCKEILVKSEPSENLSKILTHMLQ